MGILGNERLEPLMRGMQRPAEEEFVQGIKTAKLELMPLSLKDRMAELEHAEWAELEEVE